MSRKSFTILATLLVAVGTSMAGVAIWYSYWLSPWREAVARGNANAAKGNLENAITDYTRAIRLSPKQAVIYHNRGNAYTGKDDLDRAIADYTEAIQLDPKYAAAYSDRGTAYAAKGDRESGVADFYESNRDYDHAIADYDEAIRLNPTLADAYFGRGNVYSRNYSMRNRARAVADYDEAIRLNPKLIPWSWPEPPNDWNSLRVFLSRSACLGPCSVYQVEIRGDGSVSYNDVRGQQTSQISPEGVRALYRAFRRAAYLSLPDEVNKGKIYDVPVTKTSIAYDGRIKSVENNGFGRPASLRELENEIDQIAGTVKWVFR